MRKSRPSGVVSKLPGPATRARHGKQPSVGTLQHIAEHHREPREIQPGVRYISDELIKKVSKVSNILLLTSLNLTLAEDSGKKIKYIENLDKFKKLQTLNLSCNTIENIEKLDKLVKLRELNLSFNRISKIEGLETLVNLQVLNLTGNQIEHVPVWLAKRLKSLRIFRCAKNNIGSLSEISKLRPLQDLSQVSFAENPVTKVPHYRSYVIFQLRTLDILDGQPISNEERDAAQNRFSQDELEHLEKIISEQEEKLSTLEDQHNKSLHEVTVRQEEQKTWKKQQKEKEKQLEEMRNEMKAKDDLLKRKTMELTKACEKHYELEQELAFFKIDSKFGSLGQVPSTYDMEDYDGENDLIGESPYIGRARYQKNQFAFEKNLASKGQPIRIQQLAGSSDIGASPSFLRDAPQQADHSTGASYLESSGRQAKGAEGGRAVNGSLSIQSPQASPIHPDVRETLKQTMDSELADKYRSIERAQEKLAKLQGVLEGTQSQLIQATEELQKLSNLSPKRAPLAETDKGELRNTLASKMQMISTLRDNSAQIEEGMLTAQGDIQQNKADVADLRGRMQRTDSQGSLYQVMREEMSDKQHQIDTRTQDYTELHAQLEDMLNHIAQETNDVKSIEEQLRDGQVAQNDALRTELEGVVGGLQTYLHDVKQRAANQNEAYNSLQNEKDALEERLHNLEKEMGIMDSEAGGYMALREKLHNLEVSLHTKDEENQMLKSQLDETLSADANIDRDIILAQEEIEALRQSLKAAEQKSMADKQVLLNKLENEQKRAAHAVDKLKQVDVGKDMMANRIKEQLEHMQAANTELQSQLQERDNEIQELLNKSTQPQHIQQKLQDMMESIDAGQAPDESIFEEPNEVNEALMEMQRQLVDKIYTSQAEVKKAEKEKSKAESEVRNLREELSQLNLANNTHTQQNFSNDDDDTIAQLQEEISQLRDALKQSQKKQTSNQFTGLPNHFLEPTPRSDHTSIGGSQRGPLSGIGGSQWGAMSDDSDVIEEKAIYEQLQNELEDLRNRLEEKDRLASKQAMNAENEMLKLKRELDRKEKELENARNFNVPQASHPSVDGHYRDRDHHSNKDSYDVTYDRRNQGQNKATQQGKPQHHHSNQYDYPHNSGQNYRNGLPSGPPSWATQPIPHQRGGQIPPEEDPIVRELHGELEKAQDDITELVHLLKEKDHDLQDTMAQTGRSNQIVAAKEEEIEKLHDLLEDQRGEIERLNDILHRLTGKPPGTDKDAEIQQLRHDISRLRDHVAPSIGSDNHDNRVPNGYHGNGAPRERQVHFNPSVQIQPDEKNQVPYNLPSTRDSSQVGVNGRAYNSQGDNFFSGTASIDGSYRPYDGTNAPIPQDMGQATANIGHMASNMEHMASNSNQIPPGTGGTYTGKGNSNMGQPTSNMVQMPATMSQMPSHMPNIPNNQIPVTFSQIPTTHIPLVHSGVIPTIIQQGASFPAVSQVALTPAVTQQGAPPPVVTQHVAPPTTVTQHVAPPTTVTQQVAQPPTVQHIPPTTEGVPVTDDGLYCNVPEHHELEDYVSELQDKIKLLKENLAIVKEQRRSDPVLVSPVRRTKDKQKERSAIKRLKGELEDRRDELEGLDLAIESQKATLQFMKEEERKLGNEKEAANRELNDLRRANAQINQRREYLEGRLDAETEESDYDLDEEYRDQTLRGRQKYLLNEVKCLETTLAKRRAELRQSDRLLAECQSDLAAARDEAMVTVQKYDTAKAELGTTVQEVTEIDRRADVAGKELIELTEKVKSLQEEVEVLETRKSEQEETLAGINKVIASRDAEFQQLDREMQKTKDNHMELQEEIEQVKLLEEDKLNFLRESEEILNNRKAELAKISDHIESERGELEHIDREVGKKATELAQLEKQQSDRNKELAQLGKEVESEINARRHEIQETSEVLSGLHQQEEQMSSAIQDKKLHLHDLELHIKDQEANLEHLDGTLTKHKMELKSVLESLRDGKLDEEKLKESNSASLAELEKLRNATLEEKSLYSNINDAVNKKQQENERLKQSVEREHLRVKELQTERDTLMANVESLTQQKHYIQDTSRDLEAKIEQLKKRYNQIEDKISTEQTRHDVLHGEVTQREAELEEMTSLKSALQRDLQSLRKHVKDQKVEARSKQDELDEVKETHSDLEEDLKLLISQKQEISLEITAMRDTIRNLQAQCDENLREKDRSKLQLEDVKRQIADLQQRNLEGRETLSRVREGARNEETRITETELTRLGRTQEKYIQLESRVKDLEQEIVERTTEKNQLSEALNMSYVELQNLRAQITQDGVLRMEQIHDLESELEAVREQLRATTKELKKEKRTATSQIQELQTLSQDHCQRANRLTEELNNLHTQYIALQRELRIKEQSREKDSKLEKALYQLKSDIKEEVSQGLQELEKSRLVDNTGVETDILYQQKEHIEKHLLTLKQNLRLVHEDFDDVPTREVTLRDSKKSVRKDKENLEFQQQQDDIKRQLQQQMSRHAQTIESGRKQSADTLDGLKHKLNTLQDVLGSGESADIKAIRELTRSRSNSRSRNQRSRSPTWSERSRSPTREDDLLSTKDLSTSSITMATRHKSFLASRPRSREGQRSGLNDGHRSRLQEVQNITGFYSGRALPKDTEDTIQGFKDSINELKSEQFFNKDYNES